MIQSVLKGFKWDNFLGGGLLLLVGGVFFLWRGVQVIRLGLDQENWVEKTAVVTESEVTRTRSGERTNLNYDFQYEYVVDDEIYRSRRFSAAQLSPSEIEGVELYSVGDEISIFYNPDNPEQAVVVLKRPSFFVYFGMLLGVIFLLMSIGLTFTGDIGGVLMWRMERQDAKYLAYGKQYKERQDEPFETIIPEMLKNMPHSLYRTLTRYVKNGNRNLGRTYLGNKTFLKQELCEEIMARIEARVNSF